MKKLFAILLLIGCNEPIKHETKTYTGNSDWVKLHQLVTEIENKEYKSTCQSASIDAQDMVKSLEK